MQEHGPSKEQSLQKAYGYPHVHLPDFHPAFGLRGNHVQESCPQHSTHLHSSITILNYLLSTRRCNDCVSRFDLTSKELKNYYNQLGVEASHLQNLFSQPGEYNLLHKVQLKVVGLKGYRSVLVQHICEDDRCEANAKEQYHVTVFRSWQWPTISLVSLQLPMYVTSYPINFTNL
jgi:hypothetical protein